jgi:hypothetical protein
MNEINFLPETFVRHRAAKKRRYGHVVILAMTIGVLASWWLAESRKLTQLRAEEMRLQQQVGQVQNKQASYRQYQAERTLLLDQDRIRRELAQPISHTAVVEMIGHMMPPSIAMTEMTVVSRRAPLRTGADAKAARTTSGARNAPRSASADETLLIEFSGLAPNDGEIANLVGALSDHNVFSNVKMLYSRSVTTRGVIGREFRMEMQVPLDREYRPRQLAGQPQPQEVAHAH